MTSLQFFTVLVYCAEACRYITLLKFTNPLLLTTTQQFPSGNLDVCALMI